MPVLASGRKLAAFGLTEPEAGSDAGNVRPRPSSTDGEWVIDGAKQFITNSGTDITGCVTITAVTGDDEISNIIVPNGTPGYEHGEPYRKMGWNASDTRPLTFETPASPSRTCSARAGWASSSSCRSSTAAASASPRWASGSPRAPSTRRSSTRRSARPSASRSPSSRRSRPSSPTCRPRSRPPACSSTRRRSRKDRGENFTLTAAQAKLKTGRLAVRATEEAVQIHGGYGYIEEYPVCRFYRDAKILTIGEGTDEVQQMVIARQLGCCVLAVGRNRADLVGLELLDLGRAADAAADSVVVAELQLLLGAQRLARAQLW